MKGVMFTAKGKAEVLEEAKPVCGVDTVLLQTLYSAVSNGTERMFLVGGNYGPGAWPCRIAYQHVSRVVECGEAVTRFAVGDIVYTATYPGHVEYHLARESDLIVKIADGVDLVGAAMMGVASVAYHDVRRGRVAAEDRVLVVGAGLIGQFAAQSARLRGAHVVVADRNAERLALAADLAADEVVNVSAAAGIEALQRLKPFSVILECSGADVLDTIVGRRGRCEGLIARRGHARLVLVAGRHEVAYNFNAAGMAELDVIHTQHFDQVDLDQVNRLYARGDIKTRPLITRVTSIDKAPAIYDTMRDNPSELLGVVFDYGVL